MRAFLASVASLLVLTQTLPAAAPVDYLKDVKPILTAKCVSCHGAGKARAGLRVDTGAALLKGGDFGPAVIPGKSADSPLFQCLTPGGDTKLMPPRGPAVARAQVDLIKAWIDAGARVPDKEAVAAGAGGNNPDRRGFRNGRGRGREREKERERERGRERERERD